jgi:hypothetical protein
MRSLAASRPHTAGGNDRKRRRVTRPGGAGQAPLSDSDPRSLFDTAQHQHGTPRVPLLLGLGPDTPLARRQHLLIRRSHA